VVGAFFRWLMSSAARLTSARFCSFAALTLSGVGAFLAFTLLFAGLAFALPELCPELLTAAF
jgi:hypothetical protein